MAGGPIFPSSIDVTGASGNLTLGYYTPNVNTSGVGSIEGIQCVASLTADAPAIIHFNLPTTLPTGTAKLRVLGWANATGGAAKINIQDCVTPVGSSLGAATLTQEGSAPTISQTWATADIIVENKVTLAVTPVASSIYSVKATYTTSGWGLAAISTWQYSLIWE